MTHWSEFLAAQGAVLDGETLVSFGDAAAELQAAQDHAVVCDLAELGMLRVAGPDAATFLQGQLTNDVAMLAPAASQYAAWCSAKGRVLANFVVSRSDDTTFELMLPVTLIATVRKRLGMFVLRSKVSIEDVSSTRVRLGIGGPVAGQRRGRGIRHHPGAPSPRAHYGGDRDGVTRRTFRCDCRTASRRFTLGKPQGRVHVRQAFPLGNG